MGLCRKYNYPEIRFCQSHEIEDCVLYINISVKHEKGTFIEIASNQVRVTNIPNQQGKQRFNRPSSTDSKVISSYRYATRRIESATNDIVVEHQQLSEMEELILMPSFYQ